MEPEIEHHIPAVFTPDNEPYLGRQALLTFDGEIPFCLWVSSHIAAYTRSNRENLTDLQRAAYQSSLYASHTEGISSASTVLGIGKGKKIYEQQKSA